MTSTGVAFSAQQGTSAWQPNQPSRAVALLWCAFLALLVTAPWLAPGYIFGTDWPGPRRLAFPNGLDSSDLLQLAFAVTGKVLSAEIAAKLVIFIILLLAAFTAYEALPLNGLAPRSIASLVYLLNPFVYGRLHYGQVFLLAGYAILPWVALRIRHLVIQPGRGTAVVAAASLTLLGTLDLHLLVPASLLVTALSITHAATH